MEDRDKQNTQNTDEQGQPPTGQLDEQRPDETASEKGFVGTSKETDSSEAYLSEDETSEAEFAETAQGATEGIAGNEDIETGATTQRDASLDDAS